MNGMDAIVDLRMSGVKPGCVFVYLVERSDRGSAPLSETGNVQVEITRGQRIADIDFRPLVGLYVILCDAINDPDRYRQLGAAVAAAKPARLVMPIQANDGYTVHRQVAGKTETFSL